MNITVVPAADPLRFVGASAPESGSSMSRRLAFAVGTRQVEVFLNLLPGAPGTFSIDMSASELPVASVGMGGWSPDLARRGIAVPYYSSTVSWIPALSLFSNSYWDWMASNATSLTATSALYMPLTSGIRNPLHEKLVVRTSPNLDDVLPGIRHARSEFMSQVSGRTVLDIWGPAFSTIAGTLAKLQKAGLKDCIVLIHVWQHSGYDNALPGHYPANTALGGDEALASAVQAGNRAGCFVALHENYADYYPNYPRFDEDSVALDSRGEKLTAFYNPGIPIQSFATRPTRLVSNASAQSPEIHRRYGTTAAYIDVNSGVPPWWRVDMDGYVSGGGKFSSVEQANADLWAFERTAHSGPVFGEGNTHWYWTGLLDGVEAQFGAADLKVPNPQAPLFVDFDLLKIHPAQVNHGMGYYNRWLPDGQSIQNTMLLDAYRMQEIAYGHAPFVGAELWDNVPQVMIEQNLIGSVARRYGTESAKSIRYEVAGSWVDSNAASLAGDWSRVLVQYSNGDSVIANSRPEDLTWQGLTLPENGWAAKGKEFLAYTAVKAGHVVDYSETTTSYFANARNQKDIQYAGATAQPSISLFQSSGIRTVTFQIWWDVLEQPGAEDLKNFVHFVASDGTISFGADHFPTIPTSTWRPGQAFFDNSFQVWIPSTVSDGTYSMRIGLYSIITGARVRLLGQDDGTNRYIMGDLVVADNGKTLSFRPAAGKALAQDSRLNAAGSTIDFGTIQTDGMVSILREGTSWILRAYPNSRDVVVRLNASVFDPPGSITCDAGPAMTQTPTVTNGFWAVTTLGSNYCKW